MNKKVQYLIRRMRWIGRELDIAKHQGQTLLQTGLVVGAAGVGGSVTSMSANQNPQQALSALRNDTKVFKKEFRHVQTLHMLYIRAMEADRQHLDHKQG